MSDNVKSSILVICCSMRSALIARHRLKDNKIIKKKKITAEELDIATQCLVTKGILTEYTDFRGEIQVCLHFRLGVTRMYMKNRLSQEGEVFESWTRVVGKNWNKTLLTQWNFEVDKTMSGTDLQKLFNCRESEERSVEDQAGDHELFDLIFN